MNKERVRRFSLRKLSVGLVSLAVGSVFLSFNTPTASAQESTVTLPYHYVSELELTQEEKQQIVNELPSMVQSNDLAYYLVYRPQQKQLPRTGSANFVNAAISSAAVLFIVVGIALSKDKRKKVASLLLVTTVGSTLLTPSALAISNEVLARYNQQLTLSVGEQLPQPLNIPNYRYVGYIKLTKALSHQSTADTTERTSIVTTTQVSDELPQETTTSAPVSQTESRTQTVPSVETASQPVTKQETKVSETTVETTTETKVIETTTETKAIETTTETKVIETTTIETTTIEETTQRVTQVKSVVVPDEIATITPEVKEETTTTQEFETVTQSLPFETIYQADETLRYGDRVEMVAGENGQKEITRDRVTKAIQSEKTMKQPVSKIVKVGVKPLVQTEVIPFTQTSQNDETLEEGTQEIVIKGKNGQRTVTTTYTLNTQTGEVVVNQPVVTDIDAVTQVVKVGAKTTATETVPFDTVYKADNTLAYGQRVETGGQTGEKEVVRHSQTQAVLSEKMIANPITKVITIGTKPTVEVVELPFNTQEDSDETTENQTRTIAVVGVNGRRTTTTTYTLNTQTGIVTVNAPQVETIEPVTQIVKVGVKETAIQPIPFKTVYTANDTVEKGTKQTVVAGVEGQKEVVKHVQTQAVMSERVITEPTNEAITVGTKPTVTTEELPFETVEELTEELLKGVRQVITEGVKGQRTTTTTYTVNEQTGDISTNAPTVEETAPTNAHIKVGNRDKVKPVVTHANFTKDEDKKRVHLMYALTDTDNTFVSAVGKLYKGDTFVKDVAVAFDKPVIIDGLDYYTPYTLKTEVTYNLGDGNVSEPQLTEQNFVLDYKQIEFKNVTAVELYELVNGTPQKRTTLSSVPTNLTNFYAVVKTAHQKDSMVAISAIEETTKNGTPAYKLVVDFPELVQDTNGVYDKKATLYVAKDGNTPLNNETAVNYTTVQDAQAARVPVVYKNMAKLLPFYNKEYIVHIGNQMDTTHKLAQTELTDIVPMANDTFITDVHSNKTTINKLLLHYADKTVEYLPLTFKEDYKNNNIVEYTVGDTPLVYTPEAFVSDYATVINDVLPTLQAVVYNSDAVKQLVGVPADAKHGVFGDLYLEDTFNALQANLATELKKVLTSDKAMNTQVGAVSGSVAAKIKNNAAAFMLGLSYLNRWYPIQYGNLNIKDLSAYKLDFFGNNEASTIDHIINIGKSGFNTLRGSNTDKAYTTLLAPVKQQQNVFDYLNAYRELFLPNKSNNEWLKENSKAYMVEIASEVAEVKVKQDENYNKKNKYSLGIYDRIASSGDYEYKKIFLPLLTVKDEHMYVISTMSSLSIGGYERYAGQTREKGEAFKQFMRNKVNTAAVWQRDHFDFWYKILSNNVKDGLFRAMLTHDGFMYYDDVTKETWRTAYDNAPSIKEFFGPMGHYFGNNNSVAYATGRWVNFVKYRNLDRYGAAIFTHEFVHNFDSRVYFENNDRRTGLGAEVFAEGMLEAPTNQSDGIIGINNIFTNDVNAVNRYHAANPKERYQNENDLNEYMKRLFDVVYLLEYAEGQVLLSKSNAVKQKWYRKLGHEAIANSPHFANNIRPLTESEVSQLTTFDSLIENSIVNRRGYGDNATFKTNWYYTIPLVSANYSAIHNPNGAPGDVTARRMAFELLGAKGYQNGFVPYVSNKYNDEALAANKKVWSRWSNKHIGVVDDDMILKNVFNGQYKTWLDFKKAMYKERVDKLPQLKPLTIRYELGAFHPTKNVTIRTIDDLKDLIDKAVEMDMKNIDNATAKTNQSHTHTLLLRIYNGYLRQTNDFKESIFND